MSGDKKRRVVIALTYAETRTVLGLLDGCDDSTPTIFRETSRIAKRLRIADHRARNHQAASSVMRVIGKP